MKLDREEVPRAAGKGGTRGELPKPIPEMIKPHSEAAQRVLDLRNAIHKIGSKEPPVSPQIIKGLFPYYMGEKKIADTIEGDRITREIAINLSEIQNFHSEWRQSWMLDPNNKEALERMTANPSQSRGMIPLGVSFSPESSRRPDDLPEIPRSLRLMLHEDENVSHHVRRTFVLALSGMSFKNTPEGKLCQVFAKLFKERNRAQIDAHDIHMRGQFDNAALALLSYKIIYPVIREQENRDGSTTEKVGFGMNLRLLERHAEVFLARERYERLEKRISKETDSSVRAQLESELLALSEKKQDADTFIANLKKGFGIKDPGTIFETFGDRLYVRSSDLPVFDSPQPGDTAKGRAISSRSLDAALEMLTKREIPDEKKFVSQDLNTRSAEFSHRLHFATITLGELTESVSQFKEGIVDEDTRSVARNLLKQIIDISDDVRRIHDASNRTLSVEGKSPESMGTRKEKFEPLLKLAGSLSRSYETILEDLKSLLFAKSQNNQESTAGTNEGTTELQAQLNDAITEIAQNRELMLLVCEYLTSGTPPREIIEFINEYLAQSSASEPRS